MKKLLTVLLIALLAFSSLFAEAEADNKTEKNATDDYKALFMSDYSGNPSAYSFGGSRFVPTNARMAAMGGAGLSLVKAENGLFVNPASLAEGSFKFSLPSVSVTLYHAYDILKNKIIDKVKEDDKDALVSAVLDIVGTETAPFASVDTSTSMVLPFGLGFGVYARDTVYTYSGTVIDYVEASGAVGYAYAYKLGDFKLSAGVTGKFNVIAFNQRIKAATLIKSDSIQTMPLTVAVGASYPVFDVGMTAEFKGLSASVVMSNLLAKYKMGIVNTTVGGAAETAKSKIECKDFTIETKPSLDVGIGYEFDSKLLDFALAVDMKDILGMMDELETGEKNRVILKHLNAGVEIGLLDLIAVRGGFSSGYYTVGAAFDLFIFKVEAAYYWNELGTVAGQRGLDGLTVRFNLGYER